MRVRGALIALAFVASAILNAAGQTAPPTNKPSDLLDRYEHGNRDEAVRDLASIRDVSAFARDLQRSGPAWIGALGPAQVHRRTLIAATMALEVAAPRFWPEEVDPLVEWGCQLIRKNPDRDDAEREWFRASVAIFGRARDDGRLVTRPGPGAALGQLLPPVQRLADHVAHALQQWPDEGRFKLAAAMQAAVTADSEPPRDVAWVKTEAISRDSQEGKRRARAAKAIELFDDLLQQPSLRAEASVRKGYLELTLNEPQDALRSFASGEESDDTFVVYLAEFLAGRALDRMGQHDRANERYRLALRVIPDAQSANEALSANMFLAGQHEEAYELARAALSNRAGAEDPWHEFGYGDRRVVPSLMAQLREAIR